MDLKLKSVVPKVDRTKRRDFLPRGRGDNEVQIPPYLQASGTAQQAPHQRLISQTPYVRIRTRGGFTSADLVLCSANGVPGISIFQAVAGDFVGLDRGDDCVYSFGRSKTTCRIQVRTTTP
jgi:hypothetical protein